MERSKGQTAARASSLTSSGTDVLAELLSSRVRAAVLGFFVARQQERFSLTELARALSLSISSVQHECYKLERLHVLKGRREGVSRRYWLDRETSFVPLLVDLVVAVLGRERVLAYALIDVDGLQGAILAMSPAPRLVLIGSLGLEELGTVHERAATILDVDQVTIDLAFYGTTAWRDHCAGDHPVVTRLRESDPVILVGDAAKIWSA